MNIVDIIKESEEDVRVDCEKMKGVQIFFRLRFVKKKMNRKKS